jgi:ribonuclease D
VSDIPSPEYVVVDQFEQLQDVVDACRAVDVIALDTEFARFNTYYPIVGLIQIYTGKECFLIDPVAVTDIQPLSALLTDPSLLKVLHACSEDMEVFQHALGVTPGPVFDTQIASAALGIGFSVGYQALVEHYLDISLAKDQTRSDWLARPLTVDQMDYAALDVIYLLQVYHEQMEALREDDKLRWVEAESKDLGKDIPTMISPEAAYKKMKGLWQLDRQQLNLLKSLCGWREETARHNDVPRNRVVDQKALIAIVKEGIDSKQALQDVEGLLPRQARKFGDEIMSLLTKAKQVPAALCPELVTRTDAPINNKKLKLLRKVVDEKARSLSVAPELLTKRRHLEKLIRSEDEKGQYHLPAELGGWRQSVIGDDLLAALRN